MRITHFRRNGCFSLASGTLSGLRDLCTELTDSLVQPNRCGHLAWLDLVCLHQLSWLRSNESRRCFLTPESCLRAPTLAAHPSRLRAVPREIPQFIRLPRERPACRGSNLFSEPCLVCSDNPSGLALMEAASVLVPPSVALSFHRLRNVRRRATPSMRGEVHFALLLLLRAIVCAPTPVARLSQREPRTRLSVLSAGNCGQVAMV